MSAKLALVLGIALMVLTVLEAGGVGFVAASEVINDGPPILTITGLSPNPAHQGQTVTLNFSATDPEGIVTTTWVDWGDGSRPDLLLNVTSGSMCQRLTNPNTNLCTLAIGDLILAQSQDPSTIVNGSIIVFSTNPAFPNFLIVHRVIGIVPASTSAFGQVSFETKGDANPVPDCFSQNCYIPASYVVAVYHYTLSPSKTVSGSRYDTHAYPILGQARSTTYDIRINATDTNGASSQLTTTIRINNHRHQLTSTGTTTTATATASRAESELYNAGSTGLTSISTGRGNFAPSISVLVM